MENGLIEKNDWKGIAAEIVAVIGVFLITVWQLWAILYGEGGFLAIISIVFVPDLYIFIQNITGRNIKAVNLFNEKKINELRLEYKETIEKKSQENYDLKCQIKHLEEK